MLSKSIFFIFYLIFCYVTVHATPWSNDGREDVRTVGSPLVKKEERASLVSMEYGEISVVQIGDEAWGQRYHLQFITLEPNALFLPVLLHADMVFYVHSGAGRLSWTDEDGAKHVRLRRGKLRRGDVFRLHPATIFFIQSNLETDRHKLRIYAIFTNPIDNLQEPTTEAYSSIRDLILGFDKKVLQAAFKVPKEMIDELTSGTRQPAIVRAPTAEKKKSVSWETDSQILEFILGRSGSIFDVNKKKSETKAFNLLDQKPDFKNRYGQSLIVTKKDLSALKRPNLSIFMVNLTAGSMMGPHWNPMASEVSIVLQGEGMIHIVGLGTKNESGNSQSARFHVTEGDVFVVPRFHPMAQMSFANDSFVFMGFSSTTKKNHPQFLAGKASVLRTLDKQIVATSFGATNMSAFDRFLDLQEESVILECASCAEEEFRIVKEEIKRRREEEEERKIEEEERKREEEEKKRREEEEAERREEEARRRREEEARREEEEAKRQEEKRKQREEEERWKEEERERREEEEEARRKEEEEKARREEEEERREEETRREDEARKRRKEEARREEEEAERQEEERREREQKEARKEEERRRREEEKEARRKEEEERARRQEEEGEEEERREERQRSEEEEEAKKKGEEQRRRQQEEEAEEKEARRREMKEESKREEAKKKMEEAARREEEKARREEEEAERREEKEEKARRRESEGEEEEGEGREGEKTRIIWKL